MKHLFFIIAAISFGPITCYAQSQPREEKSHNSNFVIHFNPSDPNAVIISPEKKKMAIVFSDTSKLFLITPMGFPYIVASEIGPNDSDLAWIILSDKSGFIDCVVISHDKQISFASPELIELLKKNEKIGKQKLKEIQDAFTQWSRDVVKEAEQGAAANP